MHTFSNLVPYLLSLSHVSLQDSKIVHTISQLPIGHSNVIQCYPMVTQLKDGIVKPKQFTFSTSIILFKPTSFAPAKGIPK